MKLYEEVKHKDIESQYGDHNTGIPGMNDCLADTFRDNIYKERPLMDKWDALRNLLKADMSHVVHYSHDKRFEHSVTERYLRYMDELDERDKKQKEGFLFTGVPDFDREQWKKMLKNLEGLS